MFPFTFQRGFVYSEGWDFTYIVRRKVMISQQSVILSEVWGSYKDEKRFRSISLLVPIPWCTRTEHEGGPPFFLDRRTKWERVREGQKTLGRMKPLLWPRLPWTGGIRWGCDRLPISIGDDWETILSWHVMSCQVMQTQFWSLLFSISAEFGYFNGGWGLILYFSTKIWKTTP